MKPTDPQFLYLILVLPALVGLALIGDGINRILHEEGSGYLSLILGLVFFAIVILSYFFFSTYLIQTQEIDKITYLLLGQLAPSYRGIVFNLAERMMFEVITKAYGLAKEEVIKIYRKEGDLGNTASILAFRKKIKDRNLNLSVTQVYERLLEIAKDEGEKSQERKIEKMAVLFSDLDPLSVRFLARIPVGKLRLGFSDKTILDALSWMETGNKSKKAKLEKAYQVVPDVGLLGKREKEMGIDKTSIVIKREVV